MASASGLYDLAGGVWNSELLALTGLSEKHFPPVRSRTQIAGCVTREAGSYFGLPEGLPVVNGSGDGFLAHLGSECEASSSISVTLGTSAAVRQTSARPILNSSLGTFCYKSDEKTYLLGCAGNNGGNALDWGSSVFGAMKDAVLSADPPIFVPLLHGERSPDWNAGLTASWHGITASHTAADLSRSILEAVVFNLAHYIEILRNASSQKPLQIVLSGNGFLDPLAAPILATIARTPVRMPASPGLASLRGAGVCALLALGLPVSPLQTSIIGTLDDPKILERYVCYRTLRG